MSKSCVSCRNFAVLGAGHDLQNQDGSNADLPPLFVGCDLDHWEVWNGFWTEGRRTSYGHPDRPDTTAEFLACLKRARDCSDFESRERETE